MLVLDSSRTKQDFINRKGKSSSRTNELITDGYEITSVWWSDWKKDPEKCLQKIIKIIKKSKPKS